MAIRKNVNKIHQIVFATLLPPGLIILAWLFDLILLITLKLLIVGWFAVFIVVPLIFKYSYSIQRGILFLTFISYPPNLDLSKPEKLGLYGTRHFYINYKDEEDGADIKIGVWHVLPNIVVKRFAKQLHINENIIHNITADKYFDDAPLKNHLDEIKYTLVENLVGGEEFDINDVKKQKLLFDEILRNTKTSIVVYLHGNTGSRGALHRVELYKLLRRLGYHVITLDYRGYGDSADVAPTERGVVRDALAVYEYITNLTNNPVFLYGHSLGTGVSTHLLSILQDMNLPGPKAVVLEAPFNNIQDEIRQHPFSKIFRHLPWFDFTIIRPMYENELRFESDQHIAEFRQPVCIVHAEDDVVVPFKLGYQLYRAALDTRGKSWGPVEFHRFDKSFHYGHKYIVRAPNYPDILKLFYDTYREETF